MRRRSLVVILIVLAAVAGLPLSSAEPAKPVDAPSMPPEKWQEDPTCRMVFFAVLEGLYTDGVSTAAVERVVGKKKDGTLDLKATFVIQCPLCHPVYEAFCLYQQRPSFSGEKRDTLGQGLDPELEGGLQSEHLIARQRALQQVVQEWVSRRLALMRLSAEEKADWISRLEERSGQGRARLSELRVKDPEYKLWPGYGRCAACEGTTAACKILKK
jgi:hypothetical protein